MAGARQTRSRRVNQVDDELNTLDGNFVSVTPEVPHHQQEEFPPQFNAPVAELTVVPVNAAATAPTVTPVAEGPGPALLEDLLQLVRKQSEMIAEQNHRLARVEDQQKEISNKVATQLSSHRRSSSPTTQNSSASLQDNPVGEFFFRRT